MADAPILDLNLETSGKSNGTGQQGDRSDTRGPCNCGFKHWLEGVEYDFVFHLNIGPLGYNVGDNPYEVASNFLAIRGVPEWTEQHISLGDWLLQVTGPLIERWEQKQKQNPQQALPAPAPNHSPSPQSPNHSSSHPTNFAPIKLSPEEEKAALKLREEYKKQVAQQKTEDEKAKEELKKRIQMDRMENANRKATPSIASSSYSKSTNSGTQTLRTLHDSKKSRDDDDDDHGHEHVEVDEEKMKQLFQKDPFPTKWDNEMVLYKYRELGHDKLQNLLVQCGAQKQTIQQVLQWAQSYSNAHPVSSSSPSTKKTAFSGAGHKLSESPVVPPLSSSVASSAPAPAPAGVAANSADETFKAMPVTIKNTSPVTQVRVALANGSTITVTLNEDHTVLQLVQHIRHTTNMTIAFQLMGGYPKKRIDTGDTLNQSIKQAGLVRGSISQHLL